MSKRKSEKDGDEEERDQDDPPTADDATRPRKRPHVQLPWMRVPATYAPSKAIQVGDVAGMRSKLRRALCSLGHSTLFPVQAVAWEVLGGGLSSRHDLCINAPTGSGKTLAYTLPMLQRCLSEPGVKGMRALVVVPTRALASQVHSVVSGLTANMPEISVVLVNGSSSPAAEAVMLSGSRPSSPLLSLLPAVSHLAAPGDHHACAGGAAIAVVTPGRLVHHLESFGPLWRRSLDIVVVDEADRLLGQFYQGWLSTLRGALRQAPEERGPARRIVQILVSATLTHDPAKLAQFHLQSPRYIDIAPGLSHATATGEGQLQELQIVTAAHSKPQALAALLCELRDGAPEAAGPGVRAIVFASALDVTRRLAALLRSCHGHLRLPVHEFSSRVAAKDRASVLQTLASSSGWVLVASDGMTRGMDIPAVTAVINYDMPAHERTYAHRAGRTARAGRGGQVFTLLRTEHAAPFAAMLRGSGRKRPKTYRIGADAWAAARESTASALQAVQAAEEEAEAGGHPS